MMRFLKNLTLYWTGETMMLCMDLFAELWRYPFAFAAKARSAERCNVAPSGVT